MKTRLSTTSMLVVSQNQVSADLSPDLAGEVVVLGLKDGVYYELNEVGACIWRLIRQPRSVQSVVDAILEEYDVPAEECMADVLALAENLAKFGLIEIQSTEIAH
jgi:hypothetical protein